MRCLRCRQVMVADPACESFDEHIIVRVTAWRCRGCSELIEEVLTTPMGGTGVRRRIRYVVREWKPPGRRRWTSGRSSQQPYGYAAA